jgi:hypothetical protein
MRLITRTLDEVLASLDRLRGDPDTAVIVAGTDQVFIPIAMFQRWAEAPDCPRELLEFVQVIEVERAKSA